MRHPSSPLTMEDFHIWVLRGIVLRSEFGNSRALCMNQDRRDADLMLLAQQWKFRGVGYIRRAGLAGAEWHDVRGRPAECSGPGYDIGDVELMDNRRPTQGLDFYWSYGEVNEMFNITLSSDTNVEDPACIVGVRKWSWEGLSQDGPDLGSLGLELCEHVKVHDKYDLFIYTKP